MKVSFRWLGISLLAIYAAHGMQRMVDDTVFECAGVQYKKDNFGNIEIDVKNIFDDSSITEKLNNFVAQLAPKEPGKAFIIKRDHNDGYNVDSIKKAGFKHFHGDDNKTEWIIKNGSPIPDPSTAIAGARVIVKRYNPDTKYDELLIIEDKNLKGRVMFPGGSVDPQELAITAACRELKEEVNLNVKPEDLKLVALLNRVKANRYGYSDYSHYFLTSWNKVQGFLKPQESEVLRTLWIPLQGLFLCRSINGLKIDGVTSAIAEHLAKNDTTKSITLPDFRQSYKEVKDPQDTMMLHLFEINQNS